MAGVPLWAEKLLISQAHLLVLLKKIISLWFFGQ